MATQNEFKTGTDTLITLNLNIEGEVISALSQLIIVYYYLLGDVRTKFSYWAIDPSEPNLAAEAAAAVPPITVHQIILDGEIIETLIPIADTDTLSFGICSRVPVFAEISYFDSNGEKQKVLDENNCDTFITNMVKSVVEGLL